jgi:hypothetical protein
MHAGSGNLYGPDETRLKIWGHNKTGLEIIQERKMKLYSKLGLRIARIRDLP